MRTRRRKPVPQIGDLASYEPAYVPVPTLATHWGLDYQTLRKWIREGVLPAYRFGRAWRVKTSDALAFEQSGLYKVSA
jgi:excisionase family DNA binding protein